MDLIDKKPNDNVKTKNKKKVIKKMCKTCDDTGTIVLSIIVHKDGKKEPCVTMSCPECYEKKKEE